MKSKHAKVKDIYQWLDEVAPFETQAEFDNCGLQVGSMEQPVSSVLLCLDLTHDIIKEAIEIGAQCIVAHHPLIFSPIRSLNLDDHVPKLLSALIKHDIALVAAHTNLDQSAQYSPGVATAHLLGLKDIEKADDYAVVGNFQPAISPRDLQTMIVERLHSPALMFAEADVLVSRLAIGGGAYSEGMDAALLAGAQAYLTGEVKHHHAVIAQEAGLILYEGGHFATEAPLLAPLALGLQTAMDALQYSVRIVASTQKPYRLR